MTFSATTSSSVKKSLRRWRRPGAFSVRRALRGAATERTGIRDGVTDGTLRCADVARTARQISAMLNGYADLLTVNPSEAKAREALADLNQFIDCVLG